ncbi:hypothetical protein SC206_04825 [Rouxiella sp. T17]|uniref:hypothetical protein n=1 Tax=Rouxiella sp. T17 TaxID=3085684 RepID=UPI002FC5D445
MNKTFLACERSEGSAERRDLRHALRHLERSTNVVLKLQLWKKSSDSKGPSDCGPLGGMGRRPLSEANAVEFKDRQGSVKPQRRPLSEANAVEFKDRQGSVKPQRHPLSEANAVEVKVEFEPKSLPLDFQI